MAENEILDLRSSRWRKTRAALSDPLLSSTEASKRIADDLVGGLRHQLSMAFRSGQTLLMVLQAARQDRAALRAVVASFQDQQLARIIRDACNLAGPNDPPRIAQCATDMLLDGLMDRALVFARQSEGFANASRREDLANNLRAELAGRRAELGAVIEASMHGEQVRRMRRTVMRKGTPVMEARSLARTSLTISPGSRHHAQHHRP